MVFEAGILELKCQHWKFHFQCISRGVRFQLFSGAILRILYIVPFQFFLRMILFRTHNRLCCACWLRVQKN